MELDEPVAIEDYDPRWVDIFEREGLQLLDCLGDLVSDIEHIGSTAVPGLAANPIVDIMVGVPSLEDVAVHVVKLQSVGYEYFGDAGVPGRLYFRKRGENDINLSVVEYGGGHWRTNLALRDYLRAHPEEAERYADAKEMIVDDGRESLLAYSDAKAAIMNELIASAQEWRGS